MLYLSFFFFFWLAYFTWHNVLKFHPCCDAESSSSLYTGAEQGAELNLGDIIWGEVEKNSFIAFPAKGDTAGSYPQNHESPLGEDSEKFRSNCPKRTWSVCGHSSDGLVVSWVGVNIINLQVQLVWGLHACGWHTLDNINCYLLSPVGISISAK